MRQLVELQEHLASFEALGADIIAIAQKERDPEQLARIRSLVGEGISVVCDPDGVTAPFSLFDTFIIDGKGTLRRAIPGTKQARARTDVILAELAEVAGQPEPDMTYDSGRLAVAGERSSADAPVLDARWAFSHDRFEPGAVTKLMFLPEIAAGWHVSAPGSTLLSPLSVEIGLPDGLTLVKPVTFPQPLREHDDLLDAELAFYQDAIPLDALVLEMDRDFVGDTATVSVRLNYQACQDETCLPPASCTWELSLPVGKPGAQRGQLYMWESW